MQTQQVFELTMGELCASSRGEPSLRCKRSLSVSQSVSQSVNLAIQEIDSGPETTIEFKL
jgi:hypothetical protein